VIDTVTVLIVVLQYESTLAKSWFKATLGETAISLGEAYNYCRQKMFLCKRNAG
jgi:hypothetical protein